MSWLSWAAPAANAKAEAEAPAAPPTAGASAPAAKAAAAPGKAAEPAVAAATKVAETVAAAPATATAAVAATSTAVAAPSAAAVAPSAADAAPSALAAPALSGAVASPAAVSVAAPALTAPPAARPAVVEAVAAAKAVAKAVAAQAKSTAPTPGIAGAASGASATAGGSSSALTSSNGPAVAPATGKDAPIVAQVPSPSVVGITKPQTSLQATAAVTATAVPVSTPVPMPATGPVPRQGPAQITGVAPSAAAGASPALTAANAAALKKQGLMAPAHTVEVVSRAPQLASGSAPPSAVPLPQGLSPVGPAAALAAAGQAALASALGTAAAAPLVPKDGPPAVAVGRAAARGAYPVVLKQGAKPEAPIAKRYQFVFVTSEVAPWSKTGGLGEAMDGLPIALAALGHRVMTIAPRYDQYKEAWDTGYWSHVPMGETAEPVHAFHAFVTKVDRVFVDHDCFLAKLPEKTGSMLYGPAWGKDYLDNQWRFAYFAKAVLKIVQELPLNGFPYGADTFIVANDWHSALVPMYLHLQRAALPELWRGTKTALLIHNAVFQGRFDRDDSEQPPEELYNLSEILLKQFTFSMSTKVGRTNPKVERCLNWMAAGAQYADRVLTVSPTYAWEILNLPEMGVELEGLFAKKGVTGIVNGVKDGVSPTSEAFATKALMLGTFGIKDVDEKKALQKAALQEEYGLPVSATTPLCVFVGRMDLQKGYDYLLAALAATLDKLDIQVVIVGTGRADLVAASKALAKKHPMKLYLGGWMGPERYALVAGADFNLMPSRWEPCGLAQLESMRFGTLPVVAQTGGLVDTVDDLVTGLHLAGAVSVESEPDLASVELVAQALERSVALYADTAKVSEMRKKAMAAGNEFTWSNAALQYEAVCEELGVKDVLPLCSSAATVTLEVDKVVA